MHNKFESQNMYITFCKYFHRILRGYKLCCFMSSPVYSSYFRMHHITISSKSTINQHEKDCYLWYVINETKKNIKLKMIYQSQWRILNQITPTSFHGIISRIFHLSLSPILSWKMQWHDRAPNTLPSLPMQKCSDRSHWKKTNLQYLQTNQWICLLELIVVDIWVRSKT